MRKRAFKKNLIYLTIIILMNYIGTIFSYKKGYQRLDSDELEHLQKYNTSLRKCFSALCIEIKQGKYSVNDMRGCIEICKEGAHDHYQQARALYKLKSIFSLNLKKRLKIKQIKKEAYKIQKNATKLLVATQYK